MFAPCVEQNRTAVLSREEGGKSLLKTPAKEQSWPIVLFSPAIQIPMPIAPRAAQILSDLRVAVDHGWLLVGAGANSSQSAAGANPSKLRKGWPFKRVWETRTMPCSPNKAFSSSSSRPSKSML